MEAELSRALVPDEPIDGDEKSIDRLYTLSRLKAYRALCGLPWEHLTLDAKWNDLCDAAGEVLKALGKLSHTPEQPPGFDPDRFAEGYEGCSRSNLSSGGMRGSVDAYMDDSDDRNIDRVGHRRWCLNPAMGKTGFGECGRWSAMWAMDGSGPSVGNKEAVLYPPPGYVPLDYFGARHAWSIQLLRGSSTKDKLRVEVFHLDEHYQAEGAPLELDWLDMAGGRFGGSACLVFRPVDIQVQSGERYRIQVSLDGGKSLAFDYLVEFIERAPDTDGAQSKE